MPGVAEGSRLSKPRPWDLAGGMSLLSSSSRSRLLFILYVLLGWCFAAWGGSVVGVGGWIGELLLLLPVRCCFSSPVPPSASSRGRCCCCLPLATGVLLGRWCLLPPPPPAPPAPLRFLQRGAPCLLKQDALGRQVRTFPSLPGRLWGGVHGRKTQVSEEMNARGRAARLSGAGGQADMKQEGMRTLLPLLPWRRRSVGGQRSICLPASPPPPPPPPNTHTHTHTHIPSSSFGVFFMWGGMLPLHLKRAGKRIHPRRVQSKALVGRLGSERDGVIIAGKR